MGGPLLLRRFVLASSLARHMPYRCRPNGVFLTRIYLPDGTSVIRSCGTDDAQTARAVEQFVKTLKRKRQFGALELVAAKRATLADLFDAHESGRLQQVLDRADDADLFTALAEWQGSGRYKSQVGKMIRGPFPASQFTRKAISTFLSGLAVSGSTRNRYRAALSVFASWLVERDIIPHNPVRDVRSHKPNRGRMLWLEREQAQALIAALPNPNRALEALMAATGIEWQAALRLRRRDVDLVARTVHAEGSKTPWRNRVIRGTEKWAWDIFANYARDFTDNAPLFTMKPDAAIRVHHRVGRELGLPRTTLHDWRHTFAVQCLKDGYSAQIVAHQLGHHDSFLVLSRYGRFVPDDRDYQRAGHAADSRHAAGRLE